jgi:hypothetical protein
MCANFWAPTITMIITIYEKIDFWKGTKKCVELAEWLMIVRRWHFNKESVTVNSSAFKSIRMQTDFCERCEEMWEDVMLLK